MKLTTTAAVVAVLAFTMTACADNEAPCAETTPVSDGVANALTLPDLADGRSSGGGGSSQKNRRKHGDDDWFEGDDSDTADCG